MPAFFPVIVVFAFVAVMAFLVHRYIPPAVLDCEAAQPISLYRAHETMQDHGDCHIEACAAKWAAYWMLADAGQLKPTAAMEKLRERAMRS